jgi:hypothetical protein
LIFIFQIVLALLVINGIVFAPHVTMHARAKPYVWLIVLTNAAIVLSAPFEIFDFKPLWSTFDGHSLWHAGGILTTYLFCNFLIRQYEDFAHQRKGVYFD